MATERISVQGSVLAWARRSAGFRAPKDVAGKLGVSVATVEKWEDNELDPTITQLRTAAKVYHRPLAVLLLREPPADFDAMRDFRNVEQADEAEWSPELHVEFRRAVLQREVMLELSEVSPDSVPDAETVVGVSLSAGPEAGGEAIRQFLGVTMAQQRVTGDPGVALNLWISAVEARGVIVMQTKGVELSETRGFSISEWPYPVIALNGSDWPRPRLFTLLHEMAHLALNLGGLCDLHVEAAGASDIETFCNQVAASALLPASTLLSDPLVAQTSSGANWLLPELSALSSKYQVSSEAILLRLVSLGRATWTTYWQRKPEFEREYGAAREAQKEKRKGKTGGPSYYVVKARDLGHGYASSVIDAYRTRRISSIDAADYLDVRFSQIEKLTAVIR